MRWLPLVAALAGACSSSGKDYVYTHIDAANPVGVGTACTDDSQCDSALKCVPVYGGIQSPGCSTVHVIGMVCSRACTATCDFLGSGYACDEPGCGAPGVCVVRP